MRDPERLFSSNGITDFERELIGAAKNEPVPDALREQMERGLGLPGGVGAGAGAHAGAPRMAHAQGVVGVKAATVAWVSAGVIALGFVGGILGARFVGRGAPAPSAAATPATSASASALEVAGSTAAPVRRTASVPSAAPVPASSPAEALPQPSALASPSESPSESLATSPARSVTRPARPTVVEDVPAPAVAAAPPASSARSPSPPEVARSVAHRRGIATHEHERRATTTTATPATTRRDPPPVTDDLRGEIDLIDAARGALRTGTATRALELLGRYAARFPHGSLAPEGTALRVEALMRLGRSAEARAIARRFVAANPTSPLVERMNSLAR